MLSSLPIPNWLSATHLRQVNAIFLVRTNIFDEEINFPNALATLAGTSQLVSFNSPYGSFYLINRAVKSVSVELLHCGFNAQWPTAMNYGRSNELPAVHCGRRSRTFIFEFKARRVAGYTIPQKEFRGTGTRTQISR